MTLCGPTWHVSSRSGEACCELPYPIKLAFHDADTDTDTDILARILADTSDTRDRFPEVIPVAS